MARVEWRRPRSLTPAHAIVDGDTLTLCGDLAEQSAYLVSDEPLQACEECRAIIREAALSLGAVFHG